MSKKCTPLWREAHLEVKIQNTSVSDDFWKLRCRKSARRCGAKQMYKAPQCRTTFGSWDVEKVHAVVVSRSKCTKHLSVGRLLEVEMSKKCTPLWCEAHFQVNSVKNWRSRTTFGGSDVEKVSKKCTPLWREAHLEVKSVKNWRSRSTFGSWDVEKVHAVVARSTCRSENVQSTLVSKHFWKLRCRKSARRCGAKHIWKSKVLTTGDLEALLEVEMSKKCTPLWREAHFQVNSVKNWRSRTTFGGSDVEKVSKKCTPLWREAHFEVKSVKNWGFWAFFDVKMSKQ